MFSSAGFGSGAQSERQFPTSPVSAANICMLSSSAFVLSAGRGVKIRDQREVGQPDGLLALSGDANKILTECK